MLIVIPSRPEALGDDSSDDEDGVAMSSDSDKPREEIPLSERWKQEEWRGDELPTGFIEPPKRVKCNADGAKMVNFSELSPRRNML